MNAVAFVHEQLTQKKEIPEFKAGDNITVNYKIRKATRNVFKVLKVMLLNARAKAEPLLLRFAKLVTEWALSVCFLCFLQILKVLSFIK